MYSARDHNLKDWILNVSVYIFGHDDDENFVLDHDWRCHPSNLTMTDTSRIRTIFGACCRISNPHGKD